MTSWEEDEDWAQHDLDGEPVDASKTRGFLGFIYAGDRDVFPDQFVPLARIYYEHLLRSGCKSKPYPAAAEAGEMKSFRKALCDGLLPVLLFTGSKAADAVRREVWADEDHFHRALQGWHLIDGGSKRAVYVCERTSVDQWLGQPSLDQEQQLPQQVSPYLAVMLRVAAKLGISRTEAGKKDTVEAEIANEWASMFPNEKELSKISLSKMSTFVRWPAASDGKGDPNNIARRKKSPGA